MSKIPTKTLGELCNIQIGRTPPRDKSEYWNGDNLWAKIKDLNDEILTDTKEKISDTAIKLLNPPADSGTLLFSFKLTIGKMAFASKQTWFNEAIAALSVKSPNVLDNGYLFYVLKTLDWNIQTDQAVRGVTLNKKKIQNVRIPFPSINEQRKIARFLSAVDDKLNALRKKQILMKRYKKGLSQKIFNQKLRFRRDDSKSFPVWSRKTLGNVVRISKGQQLNRDTLSSEGIYPVINGGVEMSGFTFAPNSAGETVTISEGGNSCGWVGWQETPFWLGGHCYKLEPKGDNILKLFLFQELKQLESNLMRLRVGSGLPNIQKSDLLLFQVNVPHIEEQRKIAGFLSAIDLKIAQIENQIRHFEKFKRGLLQQMFV